MGGHELPTRRLAKGLGWSAGGGIALRLGNVLVSIVMARIILPEEYGVFAVALTVWSVLGVVAEFGLGTDVVRARDPARIIPTVTTIGLATSATLAASMLLGAPFIALAFDSPESVTSVRIMSLGMVAVGFMIVPAALLQREFRQRELFQIHLTGLVASAATMTVLALQNYGPVSLAVGQVVGQVVTVAGMYTVTRHRLRVGLDRGVAAASLRFCMPLAAANLVSWLLLSVDNVIVARELGPLELGLYVLAFNVSSWPMNAVGQAVRVIALPAFSGLADTSARNRALEATMGPLGIVAVLLGLGLATMAEPVVQLLYGARWSEAAVPLVGLAVFGAMRVVFDLWATFLIACGRTATVLVVQVVWILVMVPAMVVGIRVGGLAGAGWAHVLVAGVVVGPAYLLTLRAGGVAIRSIGRALLPALLAAPPTVLACRMIDQVVTPPLLVLLLAAMACILLYLAPLRRTLLRQVRELQAVNA